MSKLLEAVQEHYKKFGGSLDFDIKDMPQITKYGTVSIAKDGVKIRDFSTENTPNEGDLSLLVIDWAMDELRKSKTFFKSETHGIQRHVESIQNSLKERNWFGALFLALAMPDICGAIENPNKGVGERYKKWFRQYLGEKYVPELFSDEDCYYLRCSALHQGMVEHPKAQNKRIHFTTPVPGLSAHTNFVEDDDGGFVLQMQIDIFCEDICNAVKKWQAAVSSDPEIAQRIENLMEFYCPSKSIGS